MDNDTDADAKKKELLDKWTKKKDEDDNDDNDSDGRDLAEEEASDPEFDEEIKEFFALLKDDAEMSAQIDMILFALTESNLVEAQTLIITMIKKFLESKSNRDKLIKITNSTEAGLTEHIKELSTFIMRTSARVRDLDKNLLKKKDLQYMNDKSRANFRGMVRRFLVYELYKFVNPRRIAGETRRDNFIHNMIAGGFQRALKYEGGSPAELKKYTPDLLKKLSVAHSKFRRSGNVISI